MRSLKDLSMLIMKKIEYTNQEQNEDTPLGVVLETILFGFDSGRKERFIKQFELTNEELNLIESSITYFFE
jgi:hypothetical protein